MDKNNFIKKERTSERRMCVFQGVCLLQEWLKSWNAYKRLGCCNDNNSMIKVM